MPRRFGTLIGAVWFDMINAPAKIFHSCVAAWQATFQRQRPREKPLLAQQLVWKLEAWQLLRGGECSKLLRRVVLWAQSYGTGLFSSGCNDFVLPNPSARAGATNGRILPTSSLSAARELQKLGTLSSTLFTPQFAFCFLVLGCCGLSLCVPVGGEQRGITPLCSPERPERKPEPDPHTTQRSPRPQPHQPPHPSPGGGGEGHPGTGTL